MKDKGSEEVHLWKVLLLVFLPGLIQPIYGNRPDRDDRVSVDLPDEHLPYYFNFFQDVAKKCVNDVTCPYRIHANRNVCWGYEDGCEIGGNGSGRMYSHPVCDDDHEGWVKSKSEQIKTFFNQGDFGYVRNVRNTMHLLCEPTYREDSALECSESMMFCRGRNIMIDFRNLTKRETPVLYDTDVLGPGQIGGYCRINRKRFKDAMGPLGSLQSWTPEIQHFKELPKRPFDKGSPDCDMVVERPTILMKIDATVSYYHHFCDFFNLYLSLHANSSIRHTDPFSTDVNILIWRTIEYSSNFGVTYGAFTQHPLMSLNNVKGKRVCFKNVMFPLLPRMIFGLYYNTPLIKGCRTSGLFDAFSSFILHRLRVKRRINLDQGPINITFISRKTSYRRVLNEDVLLDALKDNPRFNVQKAEFSWTTPFVEQLRVIQNTDVLIGMHGAGLTHLLFLPEWAAVFELYNCEDEHCYADLARLRGVKYITWENLDKVKERDKDPNLKGAHAKHVNYILDRDEFLRLVNVAVEHVEKEIKHRNVPQRDEL